jgi:hypothetical protein
LASRHPRVPRGGQTRGAVSITAAVVREGRVCALLTAIAMPAQRRGAAPCDGPEDASMLPGDPRVVGVQQAIAVLAHDVGHLEGWPRHRRCFSRHLVRHSYATHLLESGADLRTIQLLLGHVEVRHTVLYLHLSQKHLQAVANPLDALTISGPDTARRTRLKHKR